MGRSAGPAAHQTQPDHVQAVGSVGVALPVSACRLHRREGDAAGDLTTAAAIHVVQNPSHIRAFWWALSRLHQRLRTSLLLMHGVSSNLHAYALRNGADKVRHYLQWHEWTLVSCRRKYLAVQERGPTCTISVVALFCSAPTLCIG